MAGEWNEQSFAELVGGRENVIGGPFGSNLTSADYTSAGIPVIRGSNMGRAGRYIGDDFVHVSPSKAQALRTNQISAGDLVVTQRGTLGQVSISPENGPASYIVSQSQMGVHVTAANRLFVYYLLNSPAFAEFLDGAAIQTGVPHINLGLLRQWRVKSPPRDEQDRIAQLLGALDDKIELNRRVAETLEAMAQALFKSWFVDFDPVYAKVNGRSVGLPDNLAALFPSTISDQGLPEGWALGSLSQLIEINPSIRLRAGTTAPYVDMGALPTNGARVQSWITRPAGGGARFGNGDTLVARITPCLENGKTGYVDFLDEGQVAWGSTEFIVLRPKKGTPPALPYLWARHAPFREHLIAAMSGTSGRQRVQADAVARWNVAVPPATVLNAFDQTVSPLFARLRSADQEAATLAALRDALLPRLLSGELRMQDTETAAAVA